MLQDFAEAHEPLLIETDICIIGAGAAGLTIARRLADAGRHVCLVESGGLDYEPEIQALNKGDVTGQPYYELHRARLRFFGGTTAIWGGRTCWLDPIDFAARPWVPMSGWPFGLEELAPYYRRAEHSLGLRSDYRDRSPFQRLGSRAPAFDENYVTASYWQFDHKIDRFTAPYNGDVLNHPRITVLTHATVTEIKANSSATGVEKVNIRNLNGGSGEVRARTYVLAAGGIENARLLLLSRSIQPDGLGNNYGLVGRCFMEHVHCRGGEIITDHPYRLLKLSGSFRYDGSRFAAALRPGEATQVRELGLNTSFNINVRQVPGADLAPAMKAFNLMRHKLAAPNRFWRQTWLSIKHSGVWLQERMDPLRPWLLTKFTNRRLYMIVRAEQSPNLDSRILLGNRTDALGQPLPVLDWRLTELDKHGAKVAVAAFDAELRRLNLGRVKPSAWLDDPSVAWEFDPLISKNPIGGYHHMGTTRMATSPRRGVVDANCRVHGVGNLYVAGSSVFPTSGWANPTLTILALAQRLADHLESKPA